MLIDLYKANGGAKWPVNTYWLSDKPIGAWHGVSTDASGRVWGSLRTTSRTSRRCRA